MTIDKDDFVIPVVSSDNKVISIPISKEISKDDFVIPVVSSDNKVIAIPVSTEISKDDFVIPVVSGDNKVIAVSTLLNDYYITLIPSGSGSIITVDDPDVDEDVKIFGIDDEKPKYHNIKVRYNDPYYDDSSFPAKEFFVINFKSKNPKEYLEKRIANIDDFVLVTRKKFGNIYRDDSRTGSQYITYIVEDPNPFTIKQNVGYIHSLHSEKNTAFLVKKKNEEGYNLKILETSSSGQYTTFAEDFGYPYIEVGPIVGEAEHEVKYSVFIDGL